ncbi:hypothetical protein CF328_g4288, partial [Tilletia controversa]
MEDLIRSLRALGLRPPSGELLVELLSSADGEPAQQKRLADLLALEKLTTNNDDEDGDSDEDEDIFITPDVVRGALLSLLDAFSRTLARARDLHRREYQAFVSSNNNNSSSSNAAPAPAAQPRRPAKAVPRAALLQRQNADIRRAQEEYHAILHSAHGVAPEPIPRLILDGPPYFTATTPLSQLRRIGIADFHAPPVHFSGRYLLCRVISPPLVYVGCTLVVDDPAGLATPLSIAHFTSNINLPPKHEGTASLLPLGTVLAVREPYVSSNHHISAGGPIQGKAATGVRVSSLTDIVVLDPDEDAEHRELLRDVHWELDIAQVLGDGERQRPPSWLREGPCTRRLRRSRSGSSSSSQGTATTADSTLSQLETFLQERRPGAAYRELTAARRRSLLPDVHKEGEEQQRQHTQAQRLVQQQVINLEARTLHALRAYDALRALKGAVDRTDIYSFPEDQSTLLQNAAVLRAPSQSPSSSSAQPTKSLIQDLYKLDRTPTALTPQMELYGPDYIHPSLAIASTPNAGRGMVTTADIPAGEVLLCCAAVEPCFAEDGDWAGVQVLRLGLAGGQVDGGHENDGGAEGVSVTTTQVMACTRLIHALIDRPELQHAVLGLTAGPHLPYSSFAQRESYPLITEAVLDGDEALAGYVLPDIDARYLDGVLQHNAFGPGRDVDVDLGVPLVPLTGDSVRSKRGEGKQKRKRRRPPAASSDLARASMPLPLAAILNHACLPNVSSIFLGSSILITSLVPLCEGVELVHSYVSGERPLLVRRAQLGKHGFECGCGLCLCERGEEGEGGEKVGLGRKRVEVGAGKMGAVVERSRMVAKNRRAGLLIAKDGGEGEEEEDLGLAFEGIVREIESTYAPARGSLWDAGSGRGQEVVLKPELFEPFVHLARCRRRKVGTWWISVQCEIKALRSVGAIVDPSWMVDSEAEILERASAADTDKEEKPILILIRAPVLRLVDSQRALVRIARMM